MFREQELSNLLMEKNYTKALALAITLDQPLRVLNMSKGADTNVVSVNSVMQCDNAVFNVLPAVECNPGQVVNTQRAVMPCGWEGNRRSGVILATRHRH